MEAARISKILQAIRKNFVCPTTNKQMYCTSYLRAMYCVGLRVGKSAGMGWYHSFEWIWIVYLHQTNYNTFKVLIGRWEWKFSPPFEKRVEVGNFSFFISIPILWHFVGNLHLPETKWHLEKVSTTTETSVLQHPYRKWWPVKFDQFPGMS